MKVLPDFFENIVLNENILIIFVEKNTMPRKTQKRKVIEPPNFGGFKPYECNRKNNGSVDLYYEEYEALKLADYNFLKHEDAAEMMGVSRATFARIYENARRKVAMAMVEIKEIKAVNGNAYFENDWYLCN